VILLFIVFTSFRTVREAERSGTSKLWREIPGSRMRAGIRPVAVLVIARSVGDEAIQPASAERFLDCFAEPVIGPRFARTRWLATTELEI
jgi:hypothetical protein